MTGSSTPERARPGRVLVVDDEERNRELLRDALGDRGYVVTEAASGADALEAATASPPDVVLLDVSMPGMDGLEVCRRLRQHEATAAIPVIIVTAHGERRDRLAGIEAGANDYLTKPVDIADLALRVRNAVALKRLHDDVAENLRRLQELERLRDGLTHMLVHDLRSPLSSVGLALEMVQMAEGVPPHVAEDLALARQSVQTMAEMIAGLLDVARLEAGEMPLQREPVLLAELAAEATALLRRRAGGPAVRVDVRAPVVVMADRDIVRRVITNLVENAVAYSPPRGVVRVVVEAESAAGRLEVVDEGPGIAAEHHERIFEKFGQARDGQARRGTGLGLTFCKLAVEAHGGRIGVRSTPGQGSEFWVVLPLAPTRP